MERRDSADVSVRPARPADAAGIAELQLRTWHDAYSRVVPPDALAALEMSAVEARWRDSIEQPPDARHRVVVALDGDTLAGFAAAGPATDDDQDPAVTADIQVLLVSLAHTGQGHGSRLLAAVTDGLREDGFTSAVMWLFEVDYPMQAFLESAGWALDGARHDLDMGELVPRVRMHTRLVD